MNKKILMIFAALLIFACQVWAGSVTITGISVTPGQPLNTDLITFNISGWAPTASSWVEYDLFSQNGASLQLDLYVKRGIADVPSYWTYSKQIQPLVPAAYSLEVRALSYYSGALEDTYNVDFTVTPEPSALALLTFSLLFFRVFQGRKI